MERIICCFQVTTKIYSDKIYNFRIHHIPSSEFLMICNSLMVLISGFPLNNRVICMGFFFFFFLYFFSSPSVQFSSVTRLCPTLRPHELQHTRPPCPSPTPIVHPNPCPLSRWCHPTISSSVVPFPSCLQSFPASGSFQMSQLFASGRQRIGVSASASLLALNIQDWFPLRWTGWILQSKGLSKSLLQYHGSKASILRCSTFFIVQLSHPCMITGKTIVLTRRTFVD